jgi:hypothetical protein
MQNMARTGIPIREKRGRIVLILFVENVDQLILFECRLIARSNKVPQAPLDQATTSVAGNFH